MGELDVFNQLLFPSFALSMAPPVWGHEFFLDHPQAKAVPKVRAAFANDKMDRKKIICIACYNHHLAVEMQKDQDEIQAGQRRGPRSSDAIEAFCKFP